MGTHRTLSSKGLGFIQSWEKFRERRYRDQGGRLTIGWGHLIKPGEQFDEPMTAKEGRHVLAEDVAATELGLSGLCNDVDLTQEEFDAICSFAFNCGLGAFYHSTLCRLIKGGHFIDASGQFPLWDHVGKKESKGLENRRLAERDVFLGHPGPRYQEAA